VLTAAAMLVALGLSAVSSASAGRVAVAKVTVTFTDTTLRVSPTTPGSGVTTFVVLNKGKKTHVLVVRGPGVKNAHTSSLRAGGHATLTLTLKPGAYALSDPIGLGEFNAVFLDVVRSTNVTAKGNGSVVNPAGDDAMCGYPVSP